MLLDDSYHIITVDKQRGQVVREMAEFFRSLCKPSELSAEIEAESTEPARS